MAAPIVPIAAAAASVIGSGTQAYAQGRMNKKTREWNEKMYQQQNIDNEKYWHMQNEYNSPRAQMQRFQEAGLNKNLIYGQGDNGNSGNLGAPSPQSWSPESPLKNMDLAQGIMSYADVQNKSAQTDNLRAQNTVLIEQAANVAADTAGKITSTARSKFDLNLAEDLRENSLQVREQELRKLNINNDVTLQENERAAAQNSASLRESAERVLEIRARVAKTADERKQINAQIQNLNKDQELKELDLELKRNGINPNDPLYMRILGRYLDDAKESAPALNSLNPMKGEKLPHRFFKKKIWKYQK